jgi:hypothetical protein
VTALTNPPAPTSGTAEEALPSPPTAPENPQHSDHQSQGEKAVGEKDSVGEKSVGENSNAAPKAENKALVKNPLVKIQNPLVSNTSDFSPTPPKSFSPTDFSRAPLVKNPLVKKIPARFKFPPLTVVKNQREVGPRGRPRNPELPPSPSKYFYWQKARNGLKLEKRRPEYEYQGFIMPDEWQHLRGQYDDNYILRIIQSAIRIKRARSLANRRTG